MQPPEFALAHYAAQAELVSAAGQVAADVWAEVNPSAVAESWASRVAEMTAVTAGAQLAAANLAEPYVAAAAAYADVVAGVVDALVPSSLSGVASDGRPLATLLGQPAIASLLALDSGVGLRDALATGWATLDMIVRTQVADAGRAAVSVGMVANRGLDGYIRVAVGKTCSRCIVLAGKWYAYNTGFDRHPRCFPAGVVVSGPAALAASRRWYEGELVTLATASGEQLALTANHPVLTRGGWRPAHLLQIGDEVVRATGSQGAAPLVVPDHQQVPALIEDVWRAFGMAGFDRVPSSAEDFHGDGRDGEVDVVYADGSLRDIRDSALAEESGESSFALGSELSLALHQERVSELIDAGHAAQSGGSIRGLGLAPSFVGGHLCRPGLSRLAWPASLDTFLGQAPLDHVATHSILAAEGVLARTGLVGDHDRIDRQLLISPRWDAPAAEFSVENSVAYADRGKDLLDRLAGQVKLDRVVELRRSYWAGHVYSLTSAEGWHIANSLIVSNCDCIHLPTTRAQAAGIVQDPRRVFDSLTRQEQDRTFTKAGARAIRDGADVSRVVNARRGAAGLTPASGGRLTEAEKRAARRGRDRGRLARTRVFGRDHFLTSEAVTKRGINRKIRLMPESIYEIAGDDREMAIRLLRLHGYIL